MLMEYKGERFRVHERTWEGFSRDYPEKAKKVKHVKESETYYDYDELNQLIEPPEEKIRETIKRSYVNITHLAAIDAMENLGKKLDYYKGAEDLIVQLGEKLIGFNPRLKMYRDELNKTYHELVKEGEIEDEKYGY